MKYAFMTFSTPTLTMEENLAAAKRFGYDGLEPRMDAGHAHGVELDASSAKRAELRRAAEEAGVELACLATSLKYADPAARADMLEQTRARLELAAEFGIPVLRVFGGTIPEGLARDAAIEHVASALAEVAPYARERGVVVCMETHDDWCDPRHVAAVMRAVDDPHVAVNWDIMHPVRMGHATMAEAFEILEPWIRHVHVHDGTGEGIELAPIGEGVYDHRTAVHRLKGVGYGGSISGEWINWSDGWESHLPREVATLRRYEAEAAARA